MRETQQRSDATDMQAVSNALVRLHKEQFGRGPTNARTHFAGSDALVCVMEDALLPAERTMVEMGEQQRIRESRTFLQVATQDEFVATVEEIISRKVRAFASAIDPDVGVVFEVFSLVPETTRGDGSKPARARPTRSGWPRPATSQPVDVSARALGAVVGGSGWWWPCAGRLRR